MTRMTVALDEQLLEEACRLSGAKTKREALEIALRQLVSRLRRQEIIAHAGAIELGLTQEELKRLREER
ncbi:MAG: type II toxin-antitoxin system VapB family antitoxin [Candidatus Caldarchaeum sp.]